VKGFEKKLQRHDNLFISYNSDTSFCATLDLPEGEYLYKFLVDDKWIVDKSKVKFT